MASNVSGGPKDANSSYSDRNYPLNVQSFVPYALTQQQQLYLQQRQQQQQHLSQQDQRNNSNKFRLSQLNLAREYPCSSNDYNTNDEEDVLFSFLLFLRIKLDVYLKKIILLF